MKLILDSNGDLYYLIRNWSITKLFIVIAFQYNSDKVEVKTESFDESSAPEKSQPSTPGQTNATQSQVSTSAITKFEANGTEGNNITILVAKANTTNNDYSENGRISDRKQSDLLNGTNREVRNIVTEQIVWISSNPRGNFTKHTHTLSFPTNNTQRNTL